MFVVNGILKFSKRFPLNVSNIFRKRPKKEAFPMIVCSFLYEYLNFYFWS